MRITSRLVGVIVAWSLVPSLALFGQAVTGTITGVVTDPSGSMVPGAQVTVRSVETGTVKTVITNDTGSYSIPFLNPGVQGSIPAFTETQGLNCSTDQDESTGMLPCSAKPSWGNPSALSSGLKSLTSPILRIGECLKAILTIRGLARFSRRSMTPGKFSLGSGSSIKDSTHLPFAWKICATSQ